MTTYGMRPEAAPRGGLSLRAPLLLALLSLPAAALPAREIEIERAAAHRIDEAWYLDAKINFAFHDDVIEALNNGVDLRIDIDILIRERREWLWDKAVGKSVIELKLEYRPLADLYIVTHLASRERVRFHGLEAALRYLGDIDRHRLPDMGLPAHGLPDRGRPAAGKTYSGRIRARLNLQHLPPPLRPVAYLSGRWRADSAPYVWSFH